MRRADEHRVEARLHQPVEERQPRLVRPHPDHLADRAVVVEQHDVEFPLDDVERLGLSRVAVRTDVCLASQADEHLVQRVGRRRDARRAARASAALRMRPLATPPRRRPSRARPRPPRPAPRRSLMRTCHPSATASRVECDTGCPGRPTRALPPRAVNAAFFGRHRVLDFGPHGHQAQVDVARRASSLDGRIGSREPGMNSPCLFGLSSATNSMRSASP